MKPSVSVAVLACLLVVVMVGASVYTVDQRQRAIVFQFGEVKDVVEDPGLHFKVPLIQNVRFFDTRILTLDTRDAEHLTIPGVGDQAVPQCRSGVDCTGSPQRHRALGVECRVWQAQARSRHLD